PRPTPSRRPPRLIRRRKATTPNAASPVTPSCGRRITSSRSTAGAELVSCRALIDGDPATDVDGAPLCVHDPQAEIAGGVRLAADEALLGLLHVLLRTPDRVGRSSESRV